MKRRTASGSGARPADEPFDRVRSLAADLPGVEESTSYGTPALKVRGKLIVRLKEDGETVAIRVEFVERDILVAAEPETFYVTDHYRNYPMMLVRLRSVASEELFILLEGAWRRLAPKRLIAAYDAERDAR